MVEEKSYKTNENTEKKEWHSPKISSLSIEMTLGGSGSDEYQEGGPDNF